MTNPPPARNHWLDVLRGLAALAVTVFHLNEPVPYVSNAYRDGVKYGWLGVPVFFILSDYVVHAAAIRTRSLADYSWRRHTRIYPPYWASVILIGLLCIGRKFATGTNDFAGWPQSPLRWAATFLAMTRPATSTQEVNWVYWTLAYELAFYAVTAAAVFRPRWFPGLVVALICLSVWPTGGLAKTLPQWSLSGLSALPGLFFLSHWPIYALGVGLSLASTGRRQARLVVIGSSVSAIVVLFPTPVVITCLATGAFIWLSARVPSREGPLSRLGEISYSLYLIHVPIGCWILVRWKVGEWAEVPWMNAAYDACVMAVCVVAAWAFYRLVERPSIRLGRLRRWQRRAPI